MNITPEQFLEQTVIMVPSQSTEGHRWQVVRARFNPMGGEIAPWYCNCPSFKYDHRHEPDVEGTPNCKHIDAVKLLDEEYHDGAPATPK